jgi:hypothetical protein
MATTPAPLYLPVQESAWHNTPEHAFRAAWESMPRVALLRGDDAIDAEDAHELLGMIYDVENGWIASVRNFDGADAKPFRTYFQTRAEAVAHLRTQLRGAGYRLLTEAT